MAEKPETTSPRVLIVDDDTQVREQLSELLKEMDFNVVGQAADGSEAIETALRLVPDVVLMDLRMPGLGGLEATRSIKEQLPSVQVIILSAYDDPALQRGARDAGVYTYLVKGCPPSLIENVTLRAWEYGNEL